MTLRPSQDDLNLVGSRSLQFGITRARIFSALFAFSLIYVVIAARLGMLAYTDEAPHHARISAAEAIAATRPDLVDRNGQIIATDLPTQSLYAEPYRIVDPREAAEKLATVFDIKNIDALAEKLDGTSKFEWVKREITPRQHREVMALGLPGIGFLPEKRRFYPGGRTAAHIAGHVNVDNQGKAGLELHIDREWLAALHETGLGRDQILEPVYSSIDIRAQHALRDELFKSMTKFHALAATGVIMDVETGEILAAASLPDYNPNFPLGALRESAINRFQTGVFEMGSIMKAVTTAMALDSPQVSLSSQFDATRPMRIGRNTVKDYKAKNRVLSVPEIFIYSSNIGTTRLARSQGIEKQKAFLKKMHLFDRLKTELQGSTKPLLPPKWSEFASATVSFGHGISVTPLHMAAAASAIVNGGRYIPPTFLPRSREDAAALSTRVISAKTSDEMRYLFRLNSEKGSGRKAAVEGFFVGGKTGTAEKVINGRYDRKRLLTSFLSAFPMDNPRYVVLVTLDEPKAIEGTHGYATAGYNAAPTAGNVIRRVAPMLGVMPRIEDGDASDMRIARAG